MDTYLDLQNQIASDLTRSDLISQIQSAILNAVKQYERHRFWFNVTRSITFQTNGNIPAGAVGQSAYTGTDLTQIPSLVRLDELWIQASPSEAYPLTWYEEGEFEPLAARHAISFGRPTCYTYVDSQILLYPTPNAVWTLRPHMHYRFPVLAQPTDSNPWTTGQQAENLIRAQAKLILYMDTLEDADGAARMLSEIPGLKAGLDYETAARKSTGRIRAPRGHF